MIKVKTFTNELKPFNTHKELDELDKQVNQFIKDERIKIIISLSDSCTTSDGNTIGIIRILAYQLSD